jgi:hypothetical protein
MAREIFSPMPTQGSSGKSSLQGRMMGLMLRVTMIAVSVKALGPAPLRAETETLQT